MSNPLEFKLQLHWKGLEKIPEAEAYFYNKLQKLLDFHFVNVEQVFKGEIVYYEKQNEYKTSVLVGIKHKPDVQAVSNKYASLEKAINEMIDKALDQLRRIKTKLKGSHH